MPTTAEIEQQLQTQQADYLRRLENEGQLPSIVSEAWDRAGGEQQKAERTKEAELLTNYGTSGARATEQYKDIWNPEARGLAISNQMASEYKPISQIRQSLAMRAEALGVATNSAVSMYQADTAKAATNLGFTQEAYNRALARDAETQRQKERAEDIALEKWKTIYNASNSGSDAAKKPATGWKADYTEDSGLQFTNAYGQPVTAVEYLASSGNDVSPEDVGLILQLDKSGNSAPVISDINNRMPRDVLQKKYPYIFGAAGQSSGTSNY